VVIIIVVVLLCGCIGTVGYLGYQLFQERQAVVSDITNVDDIFNDNDQPNSGGTNSGGTNGNEQPNGGSTVDPANIHEEIMVDNEVLTITVKVGSGHIDEVMGYYDIDCTVVNKTNQTLAMYFRDGTTIDGKGIDSFDVMFFPYEDGIDFGPNSTKEGFMSFDGSPPDKGFVNLEGTLIVYDTETFETIGEYSVSMPQL
jgi:hypothetical protein